MAGLISKIIKVGLSRPIVLMVCKVYIPVLFPLTFAIALGAIRLDRLLGFEDGFISSPDNLTIAVFTFFVALILWLGTYIQLVQIGKGSPSPTAGRTQTLVTSGIYSYSRNPSLFGKLLGVQSVGIALNSISFCFILVPILLTISLFEKVIRQEPQLIEVFGEDYLRYRNSVPLFIPWGLIFKKRRFQSAKDN
jgi:protein-S-isoprenylcysteine O-methyltransferase Ste14